MTIWHDSEGTPLIVGAKVAFNLSGDVVRGQIVEITTGRTYGREHPIVRIRRAGGTKISQVRNPMGILVL